MVDRIEGEVAGALERVEVLAQTVLAKAFLGERVLAERVATAPVNSPRRRRGADAVTLEAFGSKEIEPIDGS